MIVIVILMSFPLDLMVIQLDKIIFKQCFTYVYNKWHWAKVIQKKFKIVFSCDVIETVLFFLVES